MNIGIDVGWRKAWRDLWRERTRTSLVVTAIALGIAAFGAVLSAYAILTRELDRGYVATNPASATLTLDAAQGVQAVQALEVELLDELRSPKLGVLGVLDAEARRTVVASVKTGPIDWADARLFVVKDYGDVRISRIAPEEGDWPPATGELLIERDAMQVARARIGDTVRVRTRRGEERELRVSGTAHDVGQAQARMEQMVYGYVTSTTLAQLGEEPRLDQLLIVVDRGADRAKIARIAAGVSAWLEARGHRVRNIDVPEPGKHPHSELMGMLLLAQSAFGLVALALSGLLVVNLLTALMAAQTRQIGVMKTVGGTRGAIARVYLAQVALLGVAALAIAIPASVVGARLLCRSMATLLNYDLESLAIPAWVFLLEVAVGIAVPQLAALLPVWRASRVSIREALGDAGVGASSFGAGTLDRAVAGIGGLARPVLLALRNGFRRKGRLARTVATLAAAGLFFLVAVEARSSLIGGFDRYFATMKHDVSIGFAQWVQLEKLERAAAGVPGIARAEGWFQLDGTIPEIAAPSAMASLHGGGSTHSHVTSAPRIAVFGVPAGTRLFTPDLLEGRPLAAGDLDAVVLNSRLAQRLGQTSPGGSVSLQIGPALTTWKVVGIASEPRLAPATAYVPLDSFARVHPGVVNALRVQLDAGGSTALSEAKARLERRLEDEGLRPASSATKTGRRRSVDEHMKMIYVFLVIVSGLLLAVGGLGLLTTMSLNVFERRRELAVLRTIGATPATLAWIVVGEGVAIGLIAWSIAAAASIPLGPILARAITAALFDRLPGFAVAPGPLLFWLAVSLLVAALGSFLPAWRTSRRSIREAIGGE